MINVLTIFKKEFKSYFNSPIAYICITVFLAFTSWFFLRGFFLLNQANLRSFFGLIPWVFLFLVPALTMRLWAEEKKSGTIEILMTFPIRDFEVVSGKFLASFIFLVIMVALSFTLPLTAALLGDLDMGPVVGGYLGAFLLGGAYLAIGLFASSITENQIVGFITGVIISFTLFIVGEEFVTAQLPEFLGPILTYLGMGAHFNNIGRGLIDSRDIVYYLSIIGFFLFLNIRSVESRKWR